MYTTTKYHKVPDGTLAYDITGEGPALIFLPGWPFNRQTYRKLIPALESHFTCINIDTLGLGESKWQKHTDFSIRGHVNNLISLMTALNLTKYSLLSFNSGGAIARTLAAQEGAKIANLILLNTDIPGKRPPWLALYRLMFRTQFGRKILNTHLVKKYLIPSNIMLGLTFNDVSVIDDEFMKLFITPMVSKPLYFEGLGNYLRGFSYKEVDNFDDMSGVHQSISAPVHMIWGEEDPTFPLKYGERMANTIPALKSFNTIPKTRLLPHEEKPGLVLEALFKSLKLNY